MPHLRFGQARSLGGTQQKVGVTGGRASKLKKRVLRAVNQARLKVACPNLGGAVHQERLLTLPASRQRLHGLASLQQQRSNSRSPGQVNAPVLGEIRLGQLPGVAAVSFDHPHTPISRGFRPHYGDMVAVR